MKLGDLIREYRESHDLSQRQFANVCGLSNGYISILEKGVNPKTGKPVTPTLPQLKKLADGVGMTLNDLFDKIDDMPVDIGSGLIRIPEPEDDSGNSARWENTENKKNVIRIAARDGSYQERHLSDDQLAALKAILDQMPDVPDDL